VKAFSFSVALLSNERSSVLLTRLCLPNNHADNDCEKTNGHNRSERRKTTGTTARIYLRRQRLTRMQSHTTNALLLDCVSLRVTGRFRRRVFVRIEAYQPWARIDW
jgi:hypothetical protein